MKPLHIVAAIIFNADKSQVFITKRPDHAHKGGLWEFPGGKVESGETAQHALVRELNEEVGIDTTGCQHFQFLEFTYDDKALEFDFFTVSEFDHQPYGREGQQGQWVKVADLVNFDFPEANLPIVHRVIKKYTS
ncbi:7,8-dihydro-8-oxoguanine-triphosphatase [Vibrio sp. 10N.286.49.B3]|uniref:8-oxo-dGTP diphosphatase MutT n=1 Tax=Vibrio sp. 10N.286.49.B3 TaxID=1880855 RepID=UPI000C828E9B|nr:8-oxo-dGTP diphosphatase MutT [Vibrio sp. 10N.286.49.B3]PMH39777.1 7,8-dihydro-8-oxoguanine-triphosphatase [Vibrio sp. 10N.286.49.B3]